MEKVTITNFKNELGNDRYNCEYRRWERVGRSHDCTTYNATFDSNITLLSMTSKGHFSPPTQEDLTKLNRAEKMMVTEMKKQLSLHLGITKEEVKVLEWFEALVWERFKDVPELHQVAKISNHKYLIKYTYGEFEKTDSMVTVKRLGEKGKVLWQEYQEKAEEARKILYSIEEGI